MLSLYDSFRGRRRQFLQVGSLALGGLTLPQLLAANAAAATGNAAVKDRSVVFLFLHGGPSQIETFDPKLTAPAGIASVNGEVSTKTAGVTFGGTFPRLASLSDRLTIVRSFTTGDGNHDIKPIVSKHSSQANLGTLYARVAGANQPRGGLPTNVALFPRAVDESTQPETNSFGRFTSDGGLGSGYAPFVPGAGGDLQSDMQLNIERTRVDDRRALLASLDGARRTFDGRASDGVLPELQAQAFETILGGAAEAFNLDREDAATIERYDTAPLVRPDQIDRKWNNYNNYVDNAKSLGKLLLLARRLCERGCGFVTVTTNFVWDMHSDVNNAGVEEGMRYMGHPLDHAVSAFLEDIEDRGLSDKILLVVCGEMGRTPRINSKGGRDHWGGLAPLLLSGAGFSDGRVIGQSTRDAGEPLSEPIRIPNLVSTVMHSLLDISELRLQRGVPNEIMQAAAADPLSHFA
ncbi:MAG: DUF1501 domain-containing protein [Planctomycetaceae bacterium]